MKKNFNNIFKKSENKNNKKIIVFITKNTKVIFIYILYILKKYINYFIYFYNKKLKEKKNIE